MCIPEFCNICQLNSFIFTTDRNNMLRIFKGDTSFIPKGLEKSQLMVVST